MQHMDAAVAVVARGLTCDKVQHDVQQRPEQALIMRGVFYLDQRLG